MGSETEMGLVLVLVLHYKLDSDSEKDSEKEMGSDLVWVMGSVLV